MSSVSQRSFLLFSLTVWLGELISWHILLFYFGEKHTYNKPSKALVSSVIHYVQAYLWAWHANITLPQKTISSFPPPSKLIVQNFFRKILLFPPFSQMTVHMPESIYFIGVPFQHSNVDFIRYMFSLE
jgi:hypothetical protein